MFYLRNYVIMDIFIKGRMIKVFKYVIFENDINNYIGISSIYFGLF